MCKNNNNNNKGFNIIIYKLEGIGPHPSEMDRSGPSLWFLSGTSASPRSYLPHPIFFKTRHRLRLKGGLKVPASKEKGSKCQGVVPTPYLLNFNNILQSFGLSYVHTHNTINNFVPNMAQWVDMTRKQHVRISRGTISFSWLDNIIVKKFSFIRSSVAYSGYIHKFCLQVERSLK